MADNPFEIPQTLRDVSEQNLKQAHAAYEQLAAFVTKAMDAWMGAMPSNPVTEGFKGVRDRAMEIAMENADSAFTFAGKISNAMTFQDLMTLQTQFAQERMQAFVTQTQQLYSLIAEAFQKSEGGAIGGLRSGMPSNPLLPGFKVTGFKDVQDRAVAMAKQNAESASALIEKIGKAQNLQELLTVQIRFAQEQMQTFTTQTQELKKLIEEGVEKLRRG